MTSLNHRENDKSSSSTTLKGEHENDAYSTHRGINLNSLCSSRFSSVNLDPLRIYQDQFHKINENESINHILSPSDQVIQTSYCSCQSLNECSVSSKMILESFQQPIKNEMSENGRISDVFKCNCSESTKGLSFLSESVKCIKLLRKINHVYPNLEGLKQYLVINIQKNDKVITKTSNSSVIQCLWTYFNDDHICEYSNDDNPTRNSTSDSSIILFSCYINQKCLDEFDFLVANNFFYSKNAYLYTHLNFCNRVSSPRTFKDAKGANNNSVICIKNDAKNKFSIAKGKCRNLHTENIDKSNENEVIGSITKLKKMTNLPSVENQDSLNATLLIAQMLKNEENSCLADDTVDTKNDENIENHTHIHSSINSKMRRFNTNHDFCSPFKKIFFNNGKKIAIKIIEKKILESDEEIFHAHQEVELLKSIFCPNVVELLMSAELENEIIMAFDYADIGNLESYMSYRLMRESDAKYLCKEVLKGLAYLHDHGIVHSDLKPQNILLYNLDKLPGDKFGDLSDTPSFTRFDHEFSDGFDKQSSEHCFESKEKIKKNTGNRNRVYSDVSNSTYSKYVNTIENFRVKICDLGLARRLDGKEHSIEAKDIRGSHGYISPEVLSGNAYNCKVDTWALGVILYTLLVGFEPFYPPSTCKTNKNLNFEKNYWSDISAEAKDFIMKMLECDVDRRLDAHQALSHSWFKSTTVLLE